MKELIKIIMEKNLYIDASHPNETRVVLKSDDNIEDYEYEGLKNNLIKNNIYLGKVSQNRAISSSSICRLWKRKTRFFIF